MNIHKTWTKVLLGVLAVFILYNYAVWTFFTEDILTDRKYYNGGLDRMGYIVGSKHYRTHESTLPRTVIENRDYAGQRIDVITIGDSFSNVKFNGRDPMYQDWIASLYDLNVLNLQPLPGHDVFTTTITLLNSGYLDKVKPHSLVLEFVERHCIEVFGHEVDFKKSMPLEEIESQYRVLAFHYELPELKFINKGNFKVVQNAVLYHFSDNAFSSNVYMRELDRPMFSVRNERRLLFYKDDISNVKKATDDSMRFLNDNLNRLAALLAKKGIWLYFMPAADKYNVYSDLIVKNPYQPSVFFELLRPLPKRYALVDTKAILKKEVERGEKDVYYADDTHWSWKGAKRIAEAMAFPRTVSIRRQGRGQLTSERQ
ncbi:MAG TPA: hypothetical protein VN604_09235 [Nitrospirota bacterium]|nr:hypothetical protein [Nitrospirota bacterium]